MKAIMIDAVEYQMEKIFEQITISPSDRTLIEQQLQSSIDKEEEKFNLELRNYQLEKDKIERQQKKLLEAHFNDAIPLNLLKSEQERLSKQLAAVEHEKKSVIRHLVKSKQISLWLLISLRIAAIPTIERTIR